MKRRDFLASIGISTFPGGTTLSKWSDEVPQKSLKLNSEQYDLQIINSTHDSYFAQGSNFQIGKITTADCMDWIASIPDESVDLVFSDPPYNIGKAAWDSFESHDIYVEWCLKWIKETSRVLKPT